MGQKTLEFTFIINTDNEKTVHTVGLVKIDDILVTEDRKAWPSLSHAVGKARLMCHDAIDQLRTIPDE